MARERRRVRYWRCTRAETDADGVMTYGLQAITKDSPEGGERELRQGNGRPGLFVLGHRYYELSLHPLPGDKDHPCFFPDCERLGYHLVRDDHGS